MTVLQIVAATPPFDEPSLGVRAARLLGLAEAMGLLPGDQPIARLDRDAIIGPVRHLQRSGIGRNAALELDTAHDPARLAVLLDRLYEELVASPSPNTEADALSRVLGFELVAQLAVTSASSLRRYIARERVAPDHVAARLHHLALVASHLASGYNDFGVRRWFARPRAQLGGKAPMQLLRGDWDPDAAGPQQVLRLAEALNSSPAT
jgi:hypothetical protein